MLLCMSFSAQGSCACGAAGLDLQGRRTWSGEGKDSVLRQLSPSKAARDWRAVRLQGVLQDVLPEQGIYCKRQF